MSLTLMTSDRIEVHLDDENLTEAESEEAADLIADATLIRERVGARFPGIEVSVVHK